MMPSGQDYAFQAYLARNVLQLNMMETVTAYPVPDKKTTLHIGCVVISFFLSSTRNLNMYIDIHENLVLIVHKT